MKDKAIAKITEEAMAIGDPMAIAIEEHLTARCTNTQIAEKLLAEDKSLKKAIDVIMQKARKIAQENRKGNTGHAVISDADAYKMVDEYYGIDEKAAPARRSESQRVDVLDLF